MRELKLRLEKEKRIYRKLASKGTGKNT